MKGTRTVYRKDGSKEVTRRVSGLMRPHFLGENERSVEETYDAIQLAHLHKCIHKTKEILAADNAARFNEEIPEIAIGVLPQIKR